MAQGYGRIGCSAYTLPLPMSSRTRSTHTSMAAPHSSRIAASAGPRGSSHGSPPPAHRRDAPDPRAVTPRPLVPLLPARHAAALCAARRGPSRWRGGGGAPGRLWALREGRDSDSVTLSTVAVPFHPSGRPSSDGRSDLHETVSLLQFQTLVAKQYFDTVFFTTILAILF